MSSHLWKALYENDVDTFRHLLETATFNVRPHGARGGNLGYAAGSTIGSPPMGLGTSPVLSLKNRKHPTPGTPSGGALGSLSLTRGDINGKDAAGLTLLHHAASSAAETAQGLAAALIDHPLIDLYIQDTENGWTALHRAFYFGNIGIARLMLERDAGIAFGKASGHVQQTIGLIKIKDKEGLGPLDLYAATIKDRTLRSQLGRHSRAGSVGSNEDRPEFDRDDGRPDDQPLIPFLNVGGDQLFTFGSNKNLSLGFGDEDDRQFPERVTLKRPEHLIRRFLDEHNHQLDKKWAGHDPHYAPRKATVDDSAWEQDIPWPIRSTPLTIQDVHMSKLSTAVLTSDPESNLYMCGHGQGGRLGTGDEQTRFNFVCVEGGALAGKRVATVALGQNHTLALSTDGEVFSFGSNGFGQLGYALPKASSTDEDPISTTPRQIFGPLKREVVLGIAASRIHSVAHTPTSLFTFGKNEGQLGIIDSDARSLETQVTPRKVAASLFTSSIASVAALDRATVCLLDSHEVWVFANYGYLKVSFTLEGFSNHFLRQSFLVTTYDSTPNRIVKVIGGGDTICAMSSRGEIYTLSVKERLDTQASTSTTNPSKIRSAVTTPQSVWCPKKSNMAARDVAVDADGSIILSTEEGSVWKRTKRATIKDATAAGLGDNKPKDHKFSRISGLTRVYAVRASSHGAYAAIRKDCDVLRTQLIVEEPTLWKDLLPLLSLREILTRRPQDDPDDLRHRFWQGSQKPSEVQLLKAAISMSTDIEAEYLDLLPRMVDDPASRYDALVKTSTSDVIIPVHRFVLTARSRVLRRGFRDLCETSTFTLLDLAVSEINEDGRLLIKFQGLDILTIINYVLYCYTDTVVDFWHMIKASPKNAFRYRQIRTELMKLGTKLELGKLEPAVRQMVQPRPCLDMDMEVAFADPAFFYDGDAIVQLEDDQVRVHSVLLCARCPFFEGLFMGRAGGRWLDSRRGDEDVTVDLSHVDSRTFGLVLRHVYGDTGTELFDDIISIGVDDFLDAVMDVMSAANELMLDRLSQVCQSVVGRFVNVRNVCGLLNAIAPSSVREFKDAALEYLCLNLEAMLQGHHLNELDEDLLLELDGVVRENQLATMPFAKSGRAELLLHERHPELSAIIERNRKSKIDAATLRSKSLSLGHFAPGSVEDEVFSPPAAFKTRRRSSHAIPKAEGQGPALKARASQKDMMFAMDDESDGPPQSPSQSPAIRPMSSPRGLEPIASSPEEDVWYDNKGKVLPSPRLLPQTSVSGIASPRTPRSPLMGGKTPPSSGLPWSLTPLPGPRSDMRDIMAQTASNRTSSLSQGLAASRPVLPDTPGSFSLGAAKLSQKDRKRMQHVQPVVSPSGDSASTSRKAPNPWQVISSPQTPSVRSRFGESPRSLPTKPVSQPRSSTPHLTMRQTVAHTKTSQPQLPSLSPSTSSSRPKPTPSRSSVAQAPSAQTNSKPIPQSIRHQPLPEPVLGLSMSEILAQQQAEKAYIKDAVAKRDLQEIQAEQEFQEWWDKESARVQEAERENASPATGSTNRKAKSRHGQRGGRRGGGRTAEAGGGGGGGGVGGGRKGKENRGASGEKTTT